MAPANFSVGSISPSSVAKLLYKTIRNFDAAKGAALPIPLLPLAEVSAFSE